MTSTRVEHVTCLGCGCGCDDLTLTLTDGRITEVTPACPIGRAWFGDGSTPSEVLQEGRRVSLEQAVAEAARLLATSTTRTLVYLGLDISSQAQRLAVQLADMLGATVDSATTPTAAGGLLVAQRRGRAAATLGEIRNRADLLLFWGVDPAQRYPRFMSRFIDPAGTHVPKGRSGRTVVGVSVGRDRGPGGNLSLDLQPQDEIPALSFLRATVLKRTLPPGTPVPQELGPLAQRLAAARYTALVYDAEPTAEPRDPLRTEGLIALAEALNDAGRAAVIGLRGGGNRVGAESVLTWQTGYPLAVSFAGGSPRYQASLRGIERLANQAYAAMLVIGTPEFDASVASRVPEASSIVIGPRASRSGWNPRLVIDTGVAGIHESGTAYRLDEVPLRLRPPLGSIRTTTDVLQALVSALRSTVRPR